MENSGKISTIIPAYNAASYLEECVESVLKQTYTNFEIIIVDDGSKDNTLEVAKKLEEKDGRVVVVHQENKGLPTARNTGLKIMAGDYVFFLDSDDWIDINCFNKVVDEQKRNQADIVFFSYYKDYRNKTVEYHAYNTLVMYEKGKTSALDLYNMKTITAWGKLYTAECINGLLYNEGMRTAEDVDFNYRIYANVNTAVYIPECLLHYRILPKSAIHGYDPKVEEKFEYPINTVRGYMLGKSEIEKKAYYSFAAIAYIVVTQNGIALNKKLSIWEKINEIKDLNRKAWVHDLFENMKKIQLPMTRKLVIICGKYNIDIGILAAVKVKQKLES